jgi:hypothetical protein
MRRWNDPEALVAVVFAILFLGIGALAALH